MHGGTRPRSGPAPDPNALRRDRDQGEWTQLPEGGRQGDPPAWPLVRASVRERALWISEWLRPQAVMWERNGQMLEVAMYVRTFARAERSSAPVNIRRLLVAQMDALGLTVPGLRANRWKIAGEGAEQRATTKPPELGGLARERLKLMVSA